MHFLRLLTEKSLFQKGVHVKRVSWKMWFFLVCWLSFEWPSSIQYNTINNPKTVILLCKIDNSDAMEGQRKTDILIVFALFFSLRSEHPFVWSAWSGQGICGMWIWKLFICGLFLDIWKEHPRKLSLA